MILRDMATWRDMTRRYGVRCIWRERTRTRDASQNTRRIPQEHTKTETPHTRAPPLHAVALIFHTHHTNTHITPKSTHSESFGVIRWPECDIVCVRELVCREGVRVGGRLLTHVHRASACTLNAVGLLPVSGCGDARVASPPLAPPLCVCGEIYLTLHLTPKMRVPGRTLTAVTAHITPLRRYPLARHLDCVEYQPVVQPRLEGVREL